LTNLTALYISMKSPIKELLSQPLIEVCHNSRSNHNVDVENEQPLFVSSLSFEKDKGLARRHQKSLQKHYHPYSVDVDDYQRSVSSPIFTPSIASTRTSSSKKNKRSHLDQQSKIIKKKVQTVTFAVTAITILYPDYHSMDGVIPSIPSLLWYNSADFQRFRSECYQIATKASGDVDYQQFFLRSLYPAATAIATTASDKTYSMDVQIDAQPTLQVSKVSTTVLYPFPIVPDTKLTTKGSATLGIENFNELNMISKYRGLERIIFRNLVQPSKLSYIQDCIRCCQSNNDNANQQNHENITGDNLLDGFNLDSSPGFRQNTLSQIVAQFYGQIDEIIVQEQIRMELQQEQKHKRLLSAHQQPIAPSTLTSIRLPRPTSPHIKPAIQPRSHRQRCYMEL
jgi:hypothetical protein